MNSSPEEGATNESMYANTIQPVFAKWLRLEDRQVYA